MFSVELELEQKQSGNLAAAIQLWREALALNPAMTLVRVNLAKALLRTGNPDEAKATLENALQFNPASPEARDLLSQISATHSLRNVFRIELAGLLPVHRECQQYITGHSAELVVA